MNYEEKDDDFAIYIEELKSDDPALKINATSKVHNIAKVLGPNRVEIEFIPYLIEIIEELDNEEEYLIKLANSILNLRKYVNNQHILISPLEILAQMEENNIRNNAVKCLISLSEDQPQDFYVEYFYPKIKKLAEWENYSSKLSSCPLIVKVYQHVTEDQKQNLLEVLFKLCQDDTPMVRSTAIQQIGELTKIINDYQTIKNKFLPLWQKLVVDKVDSVKVKSLEILNILLDELSKSCKVEMDQELELIQNLAQNKNSQWRIRYTVVETSDKILKFLSNSQLDQILENVYLTLLKDQEHEVKSITISSLVNLSNFVSAEAIQNKVFPLLIDLGKDPSQYVKISLAEVVCDLAKIFNSTQLIEKSVPLIKNLFKDETFEVRHMLLKKLQNIIKKLGNSLAKEHIFSEFEKIHQDKQWKYRVAFVENIPQLTSQLSFDEYKEFLDPIVSKQYIKKIYYQIIIHKQEKRFSIHFTK